MTFSNAEKMNTYYDKLSKDINVVEALNFENLVHAQDNKSKPLHRWVHYKEGYSDELIQYYAKEWNLNSNSTLLDPFTGSGTTLTQSQQLGINSVGFEVNPFSHLMTQVKTSTWSIEEINDLKEILGKAYNLEFNNTEKDIPKLPRIHDIFEDEILNQLLTYRDFIREIENPKYQKFFRLAFLSIIEYNANARKFCSGLRYMQRKRKDVKGNFLSKCELMLEDIVFNNELPQSNVILDTCLNALNHLDKDSIDGFITSPPYANTFDYINIYKMELWFGEFVQSNDDIKELRKKMLRSHVSSKPLEVEDMLASTLNIKEELEFFVEAIQYKKLWNNHIPKMVWAYFEDTNILLHNLSQLMKINSKGALVVANSVYNGIAVPIDLLIGKLALQHNLKVTEIKVARYIDYGNSNNQRSELLSDAKLVRESIIEFEKIK